MPIVGAIFGGLDFSNYFIMLEESAAGYSGPMTYDALTKAGVPLFAYGNFITVAINFIILAFIIFLMVKQINRLKREDACRRYAGAAGGSAAAAPDSRFAEALTRPCAPRQACRGAHCFLRSFP